MVNTVLTLLPAYSRQSIVHLFGNTLLRIGCPQAPPFNGGVWGQSNTLYYSTYCIEGMDKKYKGLVTWVPSTCQVQVKLVSSIKQSRHLQHVHVYFLVFISTCYTQSRSHQASLHCVVTVLRVIYVVPQQPTGVPIGQETWVEHLKVHVLQSQDGLIILCKAQFAMQFYRTITLHILQSYIDMQVVPVIITSRCLNINGVSLCEPHTVHLPNVCTCA